MAKDDKPAGQGCLGPRVGGRRICEGWKSRVSGWGTVGRDDTRLDFDGHTVAEKTAHQLDAVGM